MAAKRRRRARATGKKGFNDIFIQGTTWTFAPICTFSYSSMMWGVVHPETAMRDGAAD
jgi:hypothetical protein